MFHKYTYINYPHYHYECQIIFILGHNVTKSHISVKDMCGLIDLHSSARCVAWKGVINKIDTVIDDSAEKLRPLSLEEMHLEVFGKNVEHFKERKRGRGLRYIPRVRWYGRWAC